MTAEELAQNVLNAMAELQSHIRAAESDNIIVEIRAEMEEGFPGQRCVLYCNMLKRLTMPRPPKPVVVVNVERVQKSGAPHKWAGMDYSKVWPDGRKEPATYEDWCNYKGIAVGPNEKIGE